MIIYLIQILNICPGYVDDGCTCRKNDTVLVKNSYGRGVGTALKCANDYELNGGFCYPPCKSGYTGIASECSST